MILIIGGSNQGKLSFAIDLLHASEKEITDGEICPLINSFDRPILNKLHILVKRLIEAETDPMDFIMKGILENPKITVISDELGCGVIPAEKAGRELREQVGRIQCEIAKRAEKVYRVYCGIPLLIKGSE